MKVKFYGTRGSVATPGAEYIKYGGNTSCILLTFNSGEIAILDAGTGLRNLGNDMVRDGYDHIDHIYLGLTHTHLDHIDGFRYFKPAYNPRMKLDIVTCGFRRPAGELDNALQGHMAPHYHPVPLDSMGSTITITQADTYSWTIKEGISVKAIETQHPVITYAYRIEDNGKTVVYCTDIEHGDDINPQIVEFAKGADLIIHDAQYTSEELPQRKGWGHSTWEQAIQVAEQGSIGKVALFHHDPDHIDSFLEEVEAQCIERYAGAFMAREGMEIEL